MSTNYDDCVLKRVNNYTGRVSCYGLEKMLCMDGVKCPFYGSSKEFYRDVKTGFVKRKDGAKNV